MNKKMLVILAAMFFVLYPLLVFSSVTEEYSSILGWEKKWEKVANRAIAKHIERIKKGPLSILSESDRENAAREMQNLLRNEMSWANTREEVANALLDECRLFFDLLVRHKKGNSLTDSEIDKLTSESTVCGEKAGKKIAKMTMRILKRSRNELKAIGRKYK